MDDHKRTQTETVSLQGQALPPMSSAWSVSACCKRALKAMRLARANVWRRFLRQRLPLDAW